jgi:hypothetical protein
LHFLVFGSTLAELSGEESIASLLIRAGQGEWATAS